MQYSLEDTFLLLNEYVSNGVSKTLVDHCISLGMLAQEYSETGMENQLPSFDTAYQFRFRSDNGESVRMEIFETNSKILQAGIQIVYKPSFLFPHINKHYKKIIKLAEKYFGTGSKMSLGTNGELINYGNEKVSFYISKIFIQGKKAITFKFGNNDSWNKNS